MANISSGLMGWWALENQQSLAQSLGTLWKRKDLQLVFFGLGTMEISAMLASSSLLLPLNSQGVYQSFDH